MPKPNENRDEGQSNISSLDQLKLLNKILDTDIGEALQWLVLCDRYNKNEKATEGLDFKVVRDVLNSYNKNSLQNFLEIRANSFLMAHYLMSAWLVKSPNLLKESKSECVSQKHVSPFKLKKEMEYLYEMSKDHLPSQIIKLLENMA